MLDVWRGVIMKAVECSLFGPSFNFYISALDF